MRPVARVPVPSMAIFRTCLRISGRQALWVYVSIKFLCLHPRFLQLYTCLPVLLCPFFDILLLLQKGHLISTIFDTTWLTTYNDQQIHHTLKHFMTPPYIEVSPTPKQKPPFSVDECSCCYVVLWVLKPEKQAGRKIKMRGAENGIRTHADRMIHGLSRPAR